MYELYRRCLQSSIMVITNLTEKIRVLMTYMHKSVNMSMEYTNIHKYYA